MNVRYSNRQDHLVDAPATSRDHHACTSVKPDISWHADFLTFANDYQATGFAKTGKRPRGVTS